MDTSDILVGGEASRYSILVGCVNWAVTLGRFDVHFSVSTMGMYNYASIKGHHGDMLIIFD